MATKNFNVSSEVSNEIAGIKFKNHSIPAKEQKLATHEGFEIISSLFIKKK